MGGGEGELIRLFGKLDEDSFKLSKEGNFTKRELLICVTNIDSGDLYLRS